MIPNVPPLEIKSTELNTLKREVSVILAQSKTLTVMSDSSLFEAGELRKTLKDIGKRIRESKESITKPMNEALKAARLFFAPVEEMYDEAENVVSRAIIQYQNEQEQIRRKIEADAARKIEEARIALEKGKMTEKAFDKIEAKFEAKVDAAPVIIKKTDTFHTRTIKRVRITDESKIPRAYLLPDMVKINQAVKAGIVVPGCELFEENTLV